MNSKNASKLCASTGFTIIEVMIVTAIAGLITIIVFIAIPQAAVSRRDAERKTYARSIYAAMIEFEKNNSRIPTCIDIPILSTPDPNDYNRDCNNAPTDAKRFVEKYVPHRTDPSTGEEYVEDTSTDHIVNVKSGNLIYRYNPSDVTHEHIPALGVVELGTGHWCSASSGSSDQSKPIQSEFAVGSHPSTEQGKFYIMMGLEKGKFYCLDNYIKQEGP